MCLLLLILHALAATKVYIFTLWQVCINWCNSLLPIIISISWSIISLNCVSGNCFCSTFSNYDNLSNKSHVIHECLPFLTSFEGIFLWNQFVITLPIFIYNFPSIYFLIFLILLALMATNVYIFTLWQIYINWYNLL